MTCTIDHAIPGTFPAFLCRRCNQFSAWTPIRQSDTSISSENDFRARHPLSEKDKEVRERLQAIEQAVAKARSYERIEALRAKAVAKVDVQKATASDPSSDLDGSKPVVLKRPGIVNTLMDMMRRKEGATRAEMRAELVRLHPDRNPAGMYSTIQRQSRELSTGKREDPKRGTVYYVVVEE